MRAGTISFYVIIVAAAWWMALAVRARFAVNAGRFRILRLVQKVVFLLPRR
jgi:hypothetical protein